jgi:ElaB/YqjD/DUF883 family membrane-anchored ribosome-binding protein
MNETNYTDVAKEQLIADFKIVVADAEALVKATAGQGGEALAKVRAKAEESLVSAKLKIAAAEAALLVRAKSAAKATDVYVHEKPWQAASVAAGIGLLVGFLLNRR